MEPVLVLVVVLAGGLIAVSARSFAQSRWLDKQAAELVALRRQQEAERATFQEVAAQHTAFADVTLDALLIVRQSHEIVVANNAALEIFPQAGTLVGKTLMMVCRNHELDALVDEVFKAKEELETQITLEERSYRVRGLLVGVPERPMLALALQDVSELVRLSRARRDMVANIVHDLGTPINSIGVLVERLITTYGVNADKDREKLTKVNVQVANLQHIARELLDLATIESGKAIIRMVDVPLADVVNSSLDLMQTQAESKKHDMLNATPADLRVLVDPDQTRRVLTNLLHNAIKFTPEQGQIRVMAAVDGEMVKITVSDNGRGIPPPDRARIFERFYQVDTARTGQKSAVGAGLGLSIAKHIVTAQGGKIWAEPNFPNGANICFTVSLAADPAPV
jgi:two-component system, OmpR family, phosphate regulon sensor histidine kinase PhoR